MNTKQFNLRPWMMLVIRSLLFLIFQASIGLIFLDNNQTSLWEGSAAWWPMTIILTDIICLVLLVKFYRQEGRLYWDVFQVNRQHLKKTC